MRKDKSAQLTIVGIGASAGGIEAFRGFFENMPRDSGMSFVVVLHLPPDRKSILPEILRRWTPMRIVEVTEGCRIEPNCVYVPPPGIVVILRGSHLHLHVPAVNEPREPTPISLLFDSLAAALGEDAIGIVLSGTGSDGALGLKAIKACGGLTLAQGTDGTGPQHDGMPSSAIATGAVDIVAAVEAMPGHILAVQKARRLSKSPAELPVHQTRAARLAICLVMNRQLGHDFSGYKEKTFLRRVERRMHVIGVASIDAYVARLEADNNEVVMLFRDMLIGVTSFFRDTETFAALNRTVLPMLFQGKQHKATIRVWVAGCATGEEAYSLAMLLREHMDSLVGATAAIQVFASDIDESAIATARTGRYPSTLLKGLSPERLNRFFVAGSDGSFTVAKELRALCTFSVHSLIRDPPFSKIDLVSCRNLLIYLNIDLQGVVIPAFHYALVPNGVLLLGSSEAVSRHESLFTVLDRPHRIFQRRDVPSPPLQVTGRTRMHEPKRIEEQVGVASGAAPIDATRISGRANARVLERFAPPFVVVNKDGEAVKFSTRTGKYLEPASGSPSQNIFNMARRGLRVPLRAALMKAVETGRPVEKSRVLVAVAGEDKQRITIAIEPLIEQGSATFYLVAFIDAGGRSDRGNADGQADYDDPIDSGSDQHLESELRDTREQLQSITEEHETGLEELRSANEELHSVNEELQSTNEELETSKEEIQSINEELQTVNAQLAEKVDELDLKNSDLRNLFESTQVATIFLDRYLIVRSFTPAVASIYNLIPSDQGRPLTDIASRLRYEELRADVGHVLSSMEPLERRVVRKDDSTHYLMRILPYRTPKSQVDGAVITFVEVTSIVRAEQHQRLLVDELNHRVKNMLTVVISLATQTLRRCQTLDEFSKVYMGRVHALAASYSLLSDQAWQTVSLLDIINEELKPFLSDSGNVFLDGPVVHLEPQAALALGMAIHELTTNAVKYGALSVPEGRVNIAWRLDAGNNDSSLVLKWIEMDGPRVTEPARRGFGMTLIERGLRQDMSADVKIEFAVNGLRAELRAPLRAEAEAKTRIDSKS